MNKTLIILEINGLQYIGKINSYFYIKSFKYEKKIIKTKKILFIGNEKKIIMGKPYINAKAEIELEFIKKTKKKIIKYKRRKRYKIIKGFKEILYKGKIKNLLWQKKKQ